VKEFARSAPFAIGKFALYRRPQSLPHELHPGGVHGAHVVVNASGGCNDWRVDPNAIARRC